jgi:hypothetical protein
MYDGGWMDAHSFMDVFHECEWGTHSIIQDIRNHTVTQSHSHAHTMGRARRDQRDAKRKQRAKKRNRGKPDDDIPNIQYSANKASSDDQQPDTSLKQATKAPAAIIKDAEKTIPPSQQDNHDSTPPFKNDHHEDNTDKSDASGLVPIPKKQAPTRIERMRIKKQQQKARRRVKNAVKQIKM